jgi:hypothetical protein
MKKTLIASLAVVSFSASATNYVSIDAENVNGLKGGKSSTAHYVRAGTEIGGIQWGVQNRTARFDNNGGLVNSLELTAGKKIGLVTPFVGVGHDEGFNGAKPYNYGLVGVTSGFQVGPGYLLNGVKTRVGSSEAIQTKQTVAFGTYSIPVTKTMSINLNASRSYQTIKETALGVGVGFKF